VTVRFETRLLVSLLAAYALAACGAEDSPNDSGRLPVLMGAGSGAGAGGAATGSSGSGAGSSAAAMMAGRGAGGSTASARGGSGGSAGAANPMMNGGAGAGTAGGGGGTVVGVGGSSGDPGACPAPPAGTSAQAIAALNAVNAARLPSGAGCASMVAEINMAAANHCNYYAMNKASGQQMCIANPHNEVSGCAGFTGMGPGQRMMAAGYNARGYSEVMAFSNNAESAVAQWINSVWHRIPILDPWTTLLGYGNAMGCDTIDFAPGMGAPNDTVVLYPYDGQTGFPTSFNGQYEGPMPPAPPTGWPSASPVTVYAKSMVVTEHLLTLDGNDTPIEHVWITGMDPMWGQYLGTAVMMYGNAPFAANTKYRVRIKGTHVGGTLDLDWTFTTGAASRFP
jgi:hypothetical protein